MNLLPLAVGGAFLLLTRRGGHPKAPPPSTQPAAGGAPAGPAPSATAAATPRTSVATLQEAGPAGGTAAAAGVPRLLTAPRLARHWHLASPVCALLASCATLALCCALGLLLRPPPLAVALLARLAALCSLASALVALKALRAKPPARRRAGASALAAGGAASLVGRLAAPAAPLTDDEWLAQARATPHELALLAPRLHGYFRRDAAASDDMGPAMDLGAPSQRMPTPSRSVRGGGRCREEAACAAGTGPDEPIAAHYSAHAVSAAQGDRADRGCRAVAHAGAWCGVLGGGQPAAAR